MSLQQFSAGSHALFLDFDGTLAEIVPQPDQVRVAPKLIATLSTLDTALNQALAIVSGRSIATLDQLLQPLRLSAAGIHGAEFRAGQGAIEQAVVDSSALAVAKQRAQAFADEHPGVLYEDKPLSFSLHYRQAPQFAEDVGSFADDLVQTLVPHFEPQRGKMVVELKPGGCHKGAAIERFMAKTPFKGRTPIYLGDDITDEDAFATVNALNGLAIKVGDGDTCARIRLESPTQVVAWLEQWEQSLRASVEHTETAFRTRRAWS